MRKGWCDPRLEAVEVPTEWDLGWATALMEGEGSFVLNKSSKNRKWTTAHAVIVQKKPWILHRLKRLFGGSVSSTLNKGVRYHRWQVYGDRARTFKRLVYHGLSPHKKKQADRIK